MSLRRSCRDGRYETRAIAGLKGSLMPEMLLIALTDRRFSYSHDVPRGSLGAKVHSRKTRDTRRKRRDVSRSAA